MRRLEVGQAPKGANMNMNPSEMMQTPVMCPQPQSQQMEQHQLHNGNPDTIAFMGVAQVGQAPMGANMSMIPSEMMMLTPVMWPQPQAQQMEHRQAGDDYPSTNNVMGVAQVGQAPRGANTHMIPSELLTPAMQLQPQAQQMEQHQVHNGYPDTNSFMGVAQVGQQR